MELAANDQGKREGQQQARGEEEVLLRRGACATVARPRREEQLPPMRVELELPRADQGAFEVVVVPDSPRSVGHLERVVAQYGAPQVGVEVLLHRTAQSLDQSSHGEDHADESVRPGPVEAQVSGDRVHVFAQVEGWGEDDLSRGARQVEVGRDARLAHQSAPHASVGQAVLRVGVLDHLARTDPHDAEQLRVATHQRLRDAIEACQRGQARAPSGKHVVRDLFRAAAHLVQAQRGLLRQQFGVSGQGIRVARRCLAP